VIWHDGVIVITPQSNQTVVGLRHLKRLMSLFSSLHQVGCDRDTAGNRRLHFDGYCGLVTLFLFNPWIASLRTLQKAVGLPAVAKTLGVQRFSLGSFSESPAVFEPEQLKRVIAELAGEIRPLATDPKLADLKHTLELVDGTLLRALPKMAESFVRHNKDGGDYHAWRLHTHLVVGAPAPHLIERTTGHDARDKGNEITHLRKSLQPDRCYVTDRRFYDVSLFNAIHAGGSSYVCRVRDDAVFELVQEKDLSQDALDAKVVRDAWVRVGRQDKADHPTRMVVVQAEPHPKRTRKGIKQSPGWVVIFTNLAETPPEIIALIYRYRWSIELFFRFLKHLLGLRHLLSQRPEGIDIQVYCCVIACLLIHLQTGKKPNKGMMDMLGFYLMGLAGEQEVIDFLNKPDNTGVKLRAKDELWKKLGVN
jgi:hypothetical protein